jgi:hypothetical protein
MSKFFLTHPNRETSQSHQIILPLKLEIPVTNTLKKVAVRRTHPSWIHTTPLPVIGQVALDTSLRVTLR